MSWKYGIEIIEKYVLVEVSRNMNLYNAPNIITG